MTIFHSSRCKAELLSNLPDLDRQDYVILNSTANVSKAIDVSHGYGSYPLHARTMTRRKKGASGIERSSPDASIDNYKAGIKTRMITCVKLAETSC